MLAIHLTFLDAVVNVLQEYIHKPYYRVGDIDIAYLGEPLRPCLMAVGNLRQQPCQYYGRSELGNGRKEFVVQYVVVPFRSCGFCEKVGQWCEYSDADVIGGYRHSRYYQ